MENNGKEVRLSRIPLKLFIEALKEVYDTGADFVDLVGQADVDQDSVGIIVKESYYNYFQEDDNDDEHEDRELTDDDLNQLI
jgi:hypothetical protein